MANNSDDDARGTLGRTPDQSEQSWTASIDLWLHLRSDDREIDGAVILLAAWGLAHDQPLAPAQMATLLETTEPLVLAAIARLDRDGHARFVRKQ